MSVYLHEISSTAFVEIHFDIKVFMFFNWMIINRNMFDLMYSIVSLFLKESQIL